MLKPMLSRMVIVDDNADFCAAVARILSGTRFEVIAYAGNAGDALRTVLELRPDLVLVDIDLGADSGLALARQLANTGRPYTPDVILISTYAEDEFADLIAEAPVLGFLPKGEISASQLSSFLRERGRRP